MLSVEVEGCVARTGVGEISVVGSTIQLFGRIVYAVEGKGCRGPADRVDEVSAIP